MYIPPHFHETEPAKITAIIEGAPLACIVAQTVHGLVANHLPLLSGPDGTLIGHVALANEMHHLIPNGQEVLTIFRGDDAYISPNFYPTKAEHHRHVPTWNYQAVHVYGKIRFLHDRQSKHAAVGLLTRIHERRVNGTLAWRMADAPKDYMAQMLDGIVALKIDIDRVLAKSKLSQNRAEVDYHGAISGLRATGHEALANQMEQHPPKQD